MTENKIDIQKWKSCYKDYRADANAVELNKSRDEKRAVVLKEMSSLLSGFLSNGVSLKEFSETFNKKAGKGKEWDFFGLAFTPSMFLNAYFKNASVERIFTEEIQKVLLVPIDFNDAKSKLEEFFGFIIDPKKKEISNLKGHVSLFVSVWWHIQDKDNWPIYYPSARNVMIANNLLAEPSERYNEHYLLFREKFLELAKDLSISIWELEHICSWLDKKGKLGAKLQIKQDGLKNKLIIQLLFSKKQIVLYGPPGTGKTYSARSLAIDLLSEE